MFKKILIANRGEIACRVIQTAKKLGISTVAVYSDADKHSKHVGLADEKYHIGGSLSAQSYLNKEKIIEVAKKSGAEAIHPGYGFLSENKDFSNLCAANDISFVGPSGDAMKLMASKSDSKNLMNSSGVACTPGYHGENQDPQFLLVEANKIKYPVIIKAVMGGGGKGMKICYGDEEFLENLESAKREALKSFGDERVLIEKYITNPKHIEVQVFGDKHGNYLYFFERDCSIQRRHQKIIEEAPSALSDKIRKEICKTAVDAARAVNYYNAGTVEFIFDQDTDEYYFMEMNTRLQVEHPITEMITNLDLVELQLKVANGEKLPMTQEQVEINGHAIEARIYSEDPFTFLPGRGVVEYYNTPKNDVRIDSGVQLGSEVGIFYDPMISKLIVHGENRQIAVSKMETALANYKIGGLVTNIGLLKKIVANQDFRDFNYDLGFIDKYKDSIADKAVLIDNDDLCCIALQIFSQKSQQNYSVPHDFTNFRVNANLFVKESLRVKYAYSYNEEFLDITSCVTQKGPNSYLLQVEIHDSEGKLLRTEKFDELSINLNNTRENTIQIDNGEKIFTREYFSGNGNLYLFNAEEYCLEVINKSNIVEVNTGETLLDAEIIKTPMPGVVVKVNCKVGDKVKKGDVVQILEAMKMENMVKSQRDGVISEVLVKESDFVEGNKTLVRFEE